MKPIGKIPTPDVSPASLSDGQETLRSRLPGITPKVRAVSSSRIEDIIGAVPVASYARATATEAGAVAADFSTQLTRDIRNCGSVEDVQSSVAAILRNSAGCSFVGWFHPSGDRIGQTAGLLNLTPSSAEPSADTLQTLHSIAAAASQQQSTVVIKLAEQSQVAVATAVSATGECLLAVCQPASDQPSDGKITAVELAGARVGEWLTAQFVRQSAEDSLQVAALVELTSLVLSHDSQKAAAQCLVDELQRHLGAVEVLYGSCPDQRPGCRLSAISQAPEVDRFADSTRVAEAVMQESMARAVASIWPTSDAANRHALLSHKQFADVKRVTSVVACPLRSESGEVVGTLVATFGSVSASPEDASQNQQQGETALRFLHAGTRSLGTAMHVVQRTTAGKISQWGSGVRKSFSKNKTKAITAAVVLMTLVMLIPVDYRVPCESVLQPVSRRYIASPFAAPLEECFVHPGDVVAQDQILARLDGRELRWELAGIRADLGKATKEHNSHLSQQEYGEAAIARHEIDRLKNKSALLSERDRNLDIRSPIAGVVVAGDLKETEGVPLETGQSLFEVAPLDRLVVEVAIPEADIRHVREGMTLSLLLDAMPSENVDATVLRIHPKAELRDHENVFIAEAELSNADQLLRPGMKGSAKISTGRRPLGWNLFHKPVAHLTGWLGW